MAQRISVIPGLQAMPLDVIADDGYSVRAYLCLAHESDLRPKPILVLLQGSRPSSVFARSEQGVALPVGVAPLLPYLDQWHLVLVEKRGVGLSETIAGGSPRARSVHSQNPQARRVSDVSSVVDHLVRSTCFDGSDVMVVGHSAGSDEAPLVACRNPAVTQVAMLAPAGGSGLFMYCASLRHRLHRGEISEADFVEQYGTAMRQFAQIMASPATADDACHKLWGSGAMGGVERHLGDLRVPVFMAIATEDQVSPPEAADLLATTMLALGKDLTVQHYLGCDHWFVCHDGQCAESYQDQVIRDLLCWASARRRQVVTKDQER
jgi:pimeloyl-ACP methyl ester carboxylesterase